DEHAEENQEEQRAHAFENIAEMKGDLQLLKSEVAEDFQELKQDIALRRRYTVPLENTRKRTPTSVGSNKPSPFNSSTPASSTNSKSHSPSSETKRIGTPPVVVRFP